MTGRSRRTTVGERCKATVHIRDTYRRARGGFRMHYTARQCSRKAAVGDLCKQHAAIEKWRYVLRWEW